MNHPELSFEPNVTYVLGFAFSPALDHVLLTVYSQPKRQEYLMNGVLGKVEPEDWCYEAAMQREFAEEAGVNTELEQWFEFADHVKSGSDSYHLVVFSAILTEDQVQPSDFINYFWYKIERVADLLEPDIGVPGTAMYITMALNHMNRTFSTRTIEFNES